MFVACGVPAILAADAPKIGVLLKGRSPFWSSVEKGAREAAEKGGVEVLVKAPLSESDIGVQVQMLHALAAQGVQAIVIAPASKDSFAVPLASLAVKGLKIVVIDTPLASKTASVFVGTDHQAAGAAAGKLLAGLVDDTDEVSILRHSQSSGAATQREVGALASFREAHAKSVVHADIYSSSEQGTEPQKAALVLSQYPKTKAILASSTPGTLAMLKVLREKKSAGAVKLVGFGFNLTPDIAEAIETGFLSGWVAQLPREVGERGVLAAIALLKGETPPAVINTDFVVITKENLHDPKVQALLSL